MQLSICGAWQVTRADELPDCLIWGGPALYFAFELAKSSSFGDICRWTLPISRLNFGALWTKVALQCKPRVHWTWTPHSAGPAFRRYEHELNQPPHKRSSSAMMLVRDTFSWI